MATTTTYRYCCWDQLPVEIKVNIISKCTFESALNLSEVDRETLLISLTEPSSPLLQDRLQSRLQLGNWRKIEVLKRRARIFKAGSLRTMWSVPPVEVARWATIRGLCKALVLALGPSVSRVLLAVELPMPAGWPYYDVFKEMESLPASIPGALWVRAKIHGDIRIDLPDSSRIKEVIFEKQTFNISWPFVVTGKSLDVLTFRGCKWKGGNEFYTTMLDLSELQNVKSMVLSDSYSHDEEHALYVGEWEGSAPWRIKFPQHTETLRIEFAERIHCFCRVRYNFAMENLLGATISNIVLKNCKLYLYDVWVWPGTLQSLEFYDSALYGKVRLSDTTFPETFQKLIVKDTKPIGRPCFTEPIDRPCLLWLEKPPKTLPEHAEVSIRLHEKDIDRYRKGAYPAEEEKFQLLLDSVCREGRWARKLVGLDIAGS